MKSKFLGWAVVVLMLAACSPGPIRVQNNEASSRSFEEYTVDLEVINNKLEVTSDPQGTEADGKQKGWVGFAKGNHGIIRFVLKGEAGKTGCTDDVETSAVWVITRVALSKFGDKDTQKGVRFGREQDGWIAHAFPTISPDGYLVNEPINKAQTSAVLLNVNNNNGPQTAYYEIEVRRCDGVGGPLRTDPGIGNRGGR